MSADCEHARNSPPGFRMVACYTCHPELEQDRAAARVNTTAESGARDRLERENARLRDDLKVTNIGAWIMTALFVVSMLLWIFGR